MARPVIFESDGLRLHGEVHLPESEGRHPGLCICHGIPAVPYNAQDAGYHDLAVRFAAAGFVTMLFFFRGAGTSEGDFDMGGWSRDLGAAITALSGMKEVDASRLFVMGFSGGAAAAIHRAAYDARIRGVISCASPAHFGDLIDGAGLDDCLTRWRDIGIIRTRGFPDDTDGWVTAFREVSPQDHVGRIAPRPVLLLHGDADEVVPVSHAHVLHGAARAPKEIITIPGGAHRLRVDEMAMSAALHWLHAHATG
jgi:uncharacterized protein